MKKNKTPSPPKSGQIWKPTNQNFQDRKIYFICFKTPTTKLDSWLDLPSEKIKLKGKSEKLRECCKIKVHDVEIKREENEKVPDQISQDFQTN